MGARPGKIVVFLKGSLGHVQGGLNQGYAATTCGAKRGAMEGWSVAGFTRPPTTFPWALHRVGGGVAKAI